MTGRARDAYANLTPLGRLLTATVPVVLLLAVALVGMTCRGGGHAPATVEDGRSMDVPAAGGSLIIAPSTAPVVPQPANTGTGEGAVAAVGAPSATSSPVSEPPPVATPVAEQAWPLSRDAMRSVLVTADWPEEWVEEALSVACGFDNPRHPSGESGCHPGLRGDGGRSLGLFQIQPRYWSERCGAGEAELLLPLPNAACALIIVRDNEAAGRPRWTFWSVQP